MDYTNLECALIGIIIGKAFMAIYQGYLRDELIESLNTYNQKLRDDYRVLLNKYESLVDELITIAGKK
jgi:hypothetical protein